jgi:plasmid stabilization system protein ParE
LSNISFNKRATEDLKGIAKYLVEHGSQAISEAFLSESRRKIDLIGRWPKIGAVWRVRYRRLGVDTFHCMIYYRLVKDGVRNVAVRRDSQKPGDWLKK